MEKKFTFQGWRVVEELRQEAHLLLIKLLFSSSLGYFEELSMFFFARLLPLIVSSLSFKVNAEFKGCQNCLQSIGREQCLCGIVCFFFSILDLSIFPAIR